MIKNLKKLLYPIGILISVVFLLVVINQLVSLYKNLELIHPLLAIAGTAIVGLIILSLIIAPLLLITKLPAPLPFPDDNTDLEQYKIDFKERLVSHPVAQRNES